MCLGLIFSGYLIENWAAVACKFCWMYQRLPITIPDIELDVSGPDKSLKHWTGNEMKNGSFFVVLKDLGKLQN